MCLGLPMRVHSSRAPGVVFCSEPDLPGAVRIVETALLDHPPRPGDWLLVHVNVAVRALAPQEASQISDALLAVTAAAAGLPFEHLLADLIDREPTLPPHLADRLPTTREPTA